MFVGFVRGHCAAEPHRIHLPIADPKTPLQSVVDIGAIESDSLCDLNVRDIPLGHPVLDGAFLHAVVLRQLILAQRTAVPFVRTNVRLARSAVCVLLHMGKNANPAQDDSTMLRHSARDSERIHHLSRPRWDCHRLLFGFLPWNQFLPVQPG